MHKRISAAQKATVVGELAGGASHREAAALAGCSKATVTAINKTEVDVIEAMKRDIQEQRLEHLAEHREQIDDALVADVLSPDSRTKPQSAKELREAAGIANQRGPLVAIDQRTFAVNVEAGQLSALSGKTPAELEDELRRRMAELGDA